MDPHHQFRSHPPQNFHPSYRYSTLLKIVSFIEFILGFLILVFSIGFIATLTAYPPIEYLSGIMGIFASIFAMIAASIGMKAFQNWTGQGWRINHFVLNIISTLFDFGILVTNGIVFGRFPYFITERFYFDLTGRNEVAVFPIGMRGTVLTLLIFLSLIVLAHFILTITSSGFLCHFWSTQNSCQGRPMQMASFGHSAPFYPPVVLQPHTIPPPTPVYYLCTDRPNVPYQMVVMNPTGPNLNGQVGHGGPVGQNPTVQVAYPSSGEVQSQTMVCATAPAVYVQSQ